MKFHDLRGKGDNGDNLPYRFKTMLRRYLCEMRDNYIVTSKIATGGLLSKRLEAINVRVGDLPAER